MALFRGIAAAFRLVATRFAHDYLFAWASVSLGAAAGVAIAFVLALRTFTMDLKQNGSNGPYVLAVDGFAGAGGN
jgi:hypothetical protein